MNHLHNEMITKTIIMNKVEKIFHFELKFVHNFRQHTTKSKMHRISQIHNLINKIQISKIILKKKFNLKTFNRLKQ